MEIGEYRMIVNSVLNLTWHVPAGMMSEYPAPEDFSKDDRLPEDIWEFVSSDIT